MARNRVTVRDRDRGYARFFRNARSAASGSLSVGVFPPRSDVRYPSGPTVAQVADWHEKGTSRMPPRPWLSSWFDGNERQLRRSVFVILQRNLTRGRVVSRFTGLGRQSVNDVRKGFASLRPLAASTRRTKGHGKILVDSGLFSRSIEFRGEVRTNKGRRTPIR